MATVTIDIPGIGTVEAENAASESTLRELVNLLKGLGGGGGGGDDGGRNGSGGGGGGGRGGSIAMKTGTAAQKALQGSARLAGKGLGMMAKTASMAVGGLQMAYKGTVKFAEGAIQVVDTFASVGDSVENAAGVFNSIPVVGTMFSTVAKSATVLNDSFIKSSQVGATFGGSVATMSSAAGEAGMTLSQFSDLMTNSGSALVALGGETEAGAIRFVQISKQIRATGQDLYALGFSTQDINEGFSNYAKQLRMQGLSDKMTNQQLVQGSQEYLKEMDALARITGEERKAKESERERLLADAQFQASMAGLQENVRDSFTNTVQQLPKGLQDFSKDILATGTATTAENQKLMSMMPRSAEMLADMNAKMQRGEEISIEERNRLNNLMRKEGGAALQSIKYAGAANSELAPLVNSLADTYKLEEDGVKKSIEGQENSQKSTDGMNEGMQKFRADLAKTSNEFMTALGTSGVLSSLANAFGFVADLAMRYVVPAFQILADGVSSAVNLFTGEGGMGGLNNAFESAKNLLYTVFTTIGDTLSVVYQAMKPVFEKVLSISSMMMEKLGPVVEDIGYIIKEFAKFISPAIQFIFDLLKPTLGFLMDIVKALSGGIKSIIRWFKGESFEDQKIADAKEQELKTAKKEAEDKKKAQKSQEKETKALETANKKLDKERQKNVDYNTTDTVGLLGQELKAQQSSLAGAEGKKKEIETERAQEKAKAEKAKEESKPDSTKTSEAQVETASGLGGGNQKTDTELLAALNTKLDALIKVAGAQLQVQKGLSSDLYS